MKKKNKKVVLVHKKRGGIGRKIVPFPEPIVTRWWLVGACVVQFKASMTTCKRACKGVFAYSATLSVVGQIALCTLGLM